MSVTKYSLLDFSGTYVNQPLLNDLHKGERNVKGDKTTSFRNGFFLGRKHCPCRYMVTHL